MSPQKRFGARRGRPGEAVGTPVRTAPPPRAALLAAVVFLGAGVCPALGQRAPGSPAPPAPPPAETAADGVRVPQWLIEVERRQRMLALLDPSRAGDVPDEPAANPPAAPPAAKPDPFESLDVANPRLTLPVLFAAFHDRTDPNGDRAAQLLARYNPEVVPVFVEALKEKGGDPVIRRRAFVGLGGAGEAAAPAVSMLRDLLDGYKDKADPERATLLQILTPFAGAPDGVSETLFRIADDPSDPLRPVAFKALLPTGRFGWDPVEQLVRAMDDPADHLHGEAEELLGSIGRGARQANDHLFKRLASRDVAERARAAYAIARVNASAQDADAVSGPLAAAVVRALRTKDRAVWSALAPCVRRSPKAVVALLPDVTDLARHDPDESVRLGARNVLMLIGAERPPEVGGGGADAAPAGGAATLATSNPAAKRAAAPTRPARPDAGAPHQP